jgi:hypothetical protein
MNSNTPLWKRGGRGDFPNIILKSPYVPLCQRGTKTTVTEALQPKEGLSQNRFGEAL